MFRLLLLVFFISHNYAQKTANCLTPMNVSGTCINIKKCEPLLAILEQGKSIPQESTNLLRDSQCGHENKDPKVCCPNQETSDKITTNSSILENKNSTSTEESTTADPFVIPEPEDVADHKNLRLLDFDLCGPLVQPKIFGGKRTGVFDFPWNALISYRTLAPEPEFKCGGTVINKRYILTAAHCVTSDGVNLLNLHKVRVGDHDTSKELDCDKDSAGNNIACADKYQEFGIESAIFHSQYTKQKWNDDIALLRVDKDINLEVPNVKPICLPIGSAAALTQKKVIVTGWGKTAFQPQSPALMMIRISLVPNGECADIYRGKVKVGYKQVCAGGERGIDSCAGDSGGPLQSPALYNDNEVKYVQYGIVSFGHGNCGVEGFPAVYTRVVYYMKWILDNLKE